MFKESTTRCYHPWGWFCPVSKSSANFANIFRFEAYASMVTDVVAWTLCACEVVSIEKPIQQTVQCQWASNIKQISDLVPHWSQTSKCDQRLIADSFLMSGPQPSGNMQTQCYWLCCQWWMTGLIGPMIAQGIEKGLIDQSMGSAQISNKEEN